RVDFKLEEWAQDTFDMDSLALQVVPNPNGLYPLSKYTSLLGTPGLTAFVGYEGLVEVNEKVISLKVIASAGSESKVEYMRSLGADVAFNYRSQSYGSVLSQHGPIHVFWDNVGGEALDAALDAMVPKSRAIICGCSGTDSIAPEQRYRLKVGLLYISTHVQAITSPAIDQNAFLIMKKRLDLRGFIVPEFIPQFFGKFMAEVPALMMQGKLKSEEAVIAEGIENAPQGLVDMLTGRGNAVGKPIIIVAKE
ncbi:hypothetical protein H0H93_009259, partial [Arthromyces matolae]